MNVAQIIVAAVSVVAIATPFAFALKWSFGDEIDRRYVWPMLVLGFIALPWVGITGMAFIADLGK